MFLNIDIPSSYYTGSFLNSDSSQITGESSCINESGI